MQNNYRDRDQNTYLLDLLWYFFIFVLLAETKRYNIHAEKSSRGANYGIWATANILPISGSQTIMD